MLETERTVRMCYIGHMGSEKREKEFRKVIWGLYECKGALSRFIRRITVVLIGR